MPGINWDDIHPQPSFATLTEVPNGSERVPQAVLSLYKGTKGLGRTIKRKTNGRMAVRTINGVVYAVPVTALSK